MRTAAQISRTPRQWKDVQQLERERVLSELLAMLDRAWRERQEWYVWIFNGRPQLTEAEYAATRPPRARAARRGRP